MKGTRRHRAERGPKFLPCHFGTRAACASAFRESAQRAYGVVSGVFNAVCRSIPRAEALRQVAFDERRKIHDLIMEGVELALKKHGYPALADMKAKWERKER